jgi:hypothetical protein
MGGNLKVTQISERHEVRVEGGGRTFVFLAEPGEGRLVIREEEDGEEICSLTLGDPEELAGFIEGLRRVFRATGLAKVARGEVDEGPPKHARKRLPGVMEPPPDEAQLQLGEPDDAEREEIIAAARQRNPKAFHPWSADEEREVRERFDRGDSIEAIASDHQRSPRAIEMRLRKMGVLQGES